MKTRGIIGQRIIGVEQGWKSGGHGYPSRISVDFLLLEDGTRLFPVTREREDGYDHDFAVNTKGKVKRGNVARSQQ